MTLSFVFVIYYLYFHLIIGQILPESISTMSYLYKYEKHIKIVEFHNILSCRMCTFSIVTYQIILYDTISS